MFDNELNVVLLADIFQELRVARVDVNLYKVNKGVAAFTRAQLQSELCLLF